MRFYDIAITTPQGQPVIPWWNTSGGSSYSSLLNGLGNPGALNIEIDFPVAPYATPRGSTRLAIWGVSIQEISQAFNLNLCNITIKAGMIKGLPLANPQQSLAPMLRGTIFKPFGNWTGNHMTLEMQILPPVGNVVQRKPMVFKWPKNTPLEQALRSTLSATFPDFQIDVKISPQLTKASDETGVAFDKLSQLAGTVKRLTTSKQFQGITTQSGAKYQGVDIVITGSTIRAYDDTVPAGNTTPSNPTKIAFQDLIGQPTWIGPSLLNFKTVMRTDIQVGDYIQLPSQIFPPYVLTTPGAAVPSPNAPSRSQSTFKGTFRTTEMHHWGNFREEPADAWVTTMDAVFLSQGGS